MPGEKKQVTQTFIFPLGKSAGYSIAVEARNYNKHLIKVSDQGGSCQVAMDLAMIEMVNAFLTDTINAIKEDPDFNKPFLND